MILVCYVAIGVGTWPVFVRYRYGQLKQRHPHTHERDVVRDAVLAMAQGALCAALWLPIVVSRYTLRVGWRLARLMLGRSLRRDFSAARVERMTAELAAMDAPNVIDLRPRRDTATAVIDRDAADALRRVICEAEQIKALILDLEAAGVIDDRRVTELREALRAKVDTMQSIADRACRVG